MTSRIEIVCDVDIAQTPESFHAYAVPDGIAIRPGDRVIMHDVPVVGFGETARCRCRATVLRANVVRRAWTRLRGLLELTGLYEVGFDPRETVA
jgi:hypothetical protein